MRILNIAISSLMVLVFTTFNSGIPIVVYLCPMMSAENPSCEMMPPATRGALSFTSVTPDCCASFIVAKRNTIPYLSVEQFKVSTPLQLDLIVYEASDAYLVHGQHLLTEVLCISPPPQFSENTSLSILNSTLLI